jgi:uncharacterized protein YdgA (DUF945 family)
MTPTTTRRGAKGCLGGNDNLKITSDSLKRNQGEVATPLQLEEGPLHLNTTRGKGRDTITQQEGTKTPEMKLPTNKRKKSKEATPQISKRGSSKEAVPPKTN